MRIAHVEAGRHLYGGAAQVAYLLEGLKGRGVDNVLLCPLGCELGAAAPAALVRALPMRGELDGWAQDAAGALALLILLDQFPRNAFRGTGRVYATDAVGNADASPATKSFTVASASNPPPDTTAPDSSRHATRASTR